MINQLLEKCESESRKTRSNLPAKCVASPPARIEVRYSRLGVLALLLLQSFQSCIRVSGLFIDASRSLRGTSTFTAGRHCDLLCETSSMRTLKCVVRMTFLSVFIVHLVMIFERRTFACEAKASSRRSQLILDYFDSHFMKATKVHVAVFIF